MNMLNDICKPSEVLETLSKEEARPLLNKARTHFRTASRSAIQFAAELRQLQDGDAHRLYGFANFGSWAEHEFEGLSAVGAQQISREGAVALALERGGRISLSGNGRNLPGPTGLRALASIGNMYGEDMMLTLYDRAQALRPGKAVVGPTVKQAALSLLPPPRVRVLDSATVLDMELPEDDDDDEEPEPVHELRDRLGVLRDLLGVLEDAAVEHRRGEYDHALAEVTDELGELSELAGSIFP